MADADDVAEITLDDFTVDEQDTTTDPSPVKDEPKDSPKDDTKDTKNEEAKDTKDEVQGDDTPTPPDVPTKDDDKEGEEVSEADKPSDEDKPLTKADERKSQLNTEIRDLVSQRNALRTEVEKANAEVYQVATEDELIEEGYSATDARVEALRQSIEMKDYNDKVADAQLTLGSESNRVLTDFPQFNPSNEQFDSELAAGAAELLEESLIRDPNSNQIIGSHISPYKLYKTLAIAQGISVEKGQLKGQADAEKMLANADTPSSTAPAKKPVDPLTELWASDL